MAETVFDTHIEKFYYDTGFDEKKGLPYITLKSNVCRKDVAYVYFYATDSYASRTLHALRNSMYAEYKAAGGPGGNLDGGVPLKIIPPFDRTVKMLVDGLVIKQRKVMVVYDILRLETPIFNYDKLIVRRNFGGSVKETVVDLRGDIFRLKERADSALLFERFFKEKRENI